jgi:hypothetical protein
VRVGHDTSASIFSAIQQGSAATASQCSDWRTSSSTALDQVVPAVAVGGNVGEADDPEHTLAVDDALTGADGVARQLDALVRGPAAAGRLWDEGSHERTSFQVAVEP